MDKWLLTGSYMKTQSTFQAFKYENGLLNWYKNSHVVYKAPESNFFLFSPNPFIFDFWCATQMEEGKNTVKTKAT